MKVSVADHFLSICLKASFKLYSNYGSLQITTEAAAADIPGGTVALSSLSPQQLQKLQTDLQREVEALSARMAQLSNAVQRLTASQENATQVGKLSLEEEIMVPLTSSIYVPGRIQDNSKVLIDIGTGFFVEKNS